MIDPLISLAFCMHSNPGVYALLIASGVSRPAQVPTGYEVINDLIRKIAKLAEADPEPDPVAWYRTTYSTEPSYGTLLQELAPAEAERSALLRSYFEPSAEEVAQGIKTPTAAHKAIAELMASGFVRVVVTTNFDRLLEKALEQAGVTPIVISTPDAAEGALPLVHTKATIIKLNGDYLDTRIKNTALELSD